MSSNPGVSGLAINTRSDKPTSTLKYSTLWDPFTRGIQMVRRYPLWNVIPFPLKLWFRIVFIVKPVPTRTISEPSVRKLFGMAQQVLENRHNQHMVASVIGMRWGQQVNGWWLCKPTPSFVYFASESAVSASSENFVQKTHQMAKIRCCFPTAWISHGGIPWRKNWHEIFPVAARIFKTFQVHCVVNARLEGYGTHVGCIINGYMTKYWSIRYC